MTVENLSAVLQTLSLIHTTVQRFYCRSVQGVRAGEIWQPVRGTPGQTRPRGSAHPGAHHRLRLAGWGHLPACWPTQQGRYGRSALWGVANRIERKWASGKGDSKLFLPMLNVEETEGGSVWHMVKVVVPLSALDSAVQGDVRCTAPALSRKGNIYSHFRTVTQDTRYMSVSFFVIESSCMYTIFRRLVSLAKYKSV